MRTITEPHHRPPLLLTVRMSHPPEKEPHLSTLSPAPTPPTSLPPSPNPSHVSSPPQSPNNSPSSTDALLNALTSDPYCDDGVELVMDVLTNEKPLPAPLPPANVDRLVASWKTTDWGSKKPSRSTVQKLLQTDAFPKQRLRSAAASKPPEPCEWSHAEDCILADVFTSVPPERQQEEFQRRLPEKCWLEAQRRYQLVIDRVCTEEDVEPDKKGKRTLRDYTRRFWRRRAQGTLKPECFISKTLSKLR